MPVTDVQMELLRAHIAGQEDAVGLARNHMSSTEGLGALVRAAFAVAARRRFYPSWTRAQVILFVGRVRALFANVPSWLTPRPPSGNCEGRSASRYRPTGISRRAPAHSFLCSTSLLRS